MNIDPIGHFIIFGPTGSGKTYYTKHLLQTLHFKKIYVFAGERHQWMNPTVGQQRTSSTAYEVQTDPFPTACDSIIQYTSDYMTKQRSKNPDYNECPFAVVFDDYNDEINTSHDEHYKKLYTKGRHNGIRVINLAHYTKAIGPVARSNVKYIAMMATMPEDEIRSIADIWYGRDHLKLAKYAREALEESEYSVVLFNRTTKHITTTIAPMRDTHNNGVIVQNAITEPDDQPVATYNHSVIVEPHPNSTISQRPESVAYNRIGSTLNIGNKQANNLYDNSRNQFNIDHTIRQDQKIEANQVNNRLKFQNIRVNNTINMYQEMHDVHDIIHKPWKSPDEIQKIVYVLNKTLRPTPPFTIHDYEEGLPEFERRYFNNTRYRNPESVESRFIAGAGNMLLSRDNPLMLMNSVYSLYNAACRR